VYVPAVYPLLQERGAGLRREGVRFVDLTRLFEHESGPIYADMCCHVNPGGNALLAEAVASRLASALPAAL
jgi:hypothetical protein